MKLTQLFPSALVGAFISASYVLIAQYFQVTAIWLPFVSWVSYSLVGGRPSFLPKMIVGYFGGMCAGYLTFLLVGPVSSLVGMFYAWPLVIFFLVFLISLLEVVKPIDMIPIYFLSYASFFAYFFGGFGGKNATPATILPIFWSLVMLGLGMGYFTTELRKYILRIQGIRK